MLMIEPVHHRLLLLQKRWDIECRSLALLLNIETLNITKPRYYNQPSTNRYIYCSENVACSNITSI